MMAVKVGSARIDENGKTHGGKAGDQNGKEVSTQAWYRHKKGWRVLRCNDADKAEKIARAMQAACDNANIGYDQYQRDTLYNLAKTVDFDPGRVKTPCETDCSALVRVCLAYAGITVKNFRTPNEASILLRSGEFIELKESRYTDQSGYLRRGDILVTRTQGHTVVVLSNGSKAETTPAEETPRTILKRGMKGEDVRRLQQRLIELGYALPRYGADGDYGSETVTAVKAFQRDRGLQVDGVAGEATLAALYAGQVNTYTVTLHNVPEAEAIALISKYDGEIQGALG
nr:MAG TPA: N acetylmuramidase [Caudoviricetes sp.]